VRKWLLRLVLLVLWGVSLVYAFGLGGLAGMYQPQAVQGAASLASGLAIMLMPRPCAAGDVADCGFADTRDRQQVDCAPFREASTRRAVLLAFGQSNSANAGRDRYMARHDVVNFNPHDGNCYRAQDPLLGPDGEGGAVWGVLGDMLIESGVYDSVLIVPFGIGGTSIMRWAPEGDLHPRVAHTAAQLRAAGIRPTHVLWHQGEADAQSLAGSAYTMLFGQLLTALRGYGIDAPVYPAVATRCGDDGDAGLRAAQAALPEAFAGVRRGADTDQLTGPAYRYDDCHFHAAGMRAHAGLWLRALATRPLEP